MGDAGFVPEETRRQDRHQAWNRADPTWRTAKFGLRYVHLPHGYDGVPADRTKELAKAVRELEGPIFIHCHHGKHRSPAAAAVACVSAGLIPPEAAYRPLRGGRRETVIEGFISPAEAARPIDPAVLDRLAVEFKQVADVPAMAEQWSRSSTGMITSSSSPPTAQADAARACPERRSARGVDASRAHDRVAANGGSSSRRPAFRKLLRQGEQHAEALWSKRTVAGTPTERPTA